MHPELSGGITIFTVRNVDVANFCVAMDTLIDQDAICVIRYNKLGSLEGPKVIFLTIPNV